MTLDQGKKDERPVFVLK